jgi:hypothetical protein
MCTRPAVVLVVLGLLARGEGGAAERSSLLDDEDRRTLEAGRVLARVLDTPDRIEVMSLGALRTAVDVERFLALARSARGFGRPEDSLGEGRLSAAPTAGDFSGLSLDEREVEDLARCRLDDCRLRLSAEAIASLRREVDFEATDRARAAEWAFREMLAREARAYAADGRRALDDYADGRHSRERAAGLAELLRRPLPPLEGASGLKEWLQAFPQRDVRLVDDFLAWRKDRFWKKPVIGLFHVAVWEGTAADRRIVVATQQLYASHYLESGIEVVELRPGRSGADAEITLWSRVRADIRPSGFNWLERVLLRRMVRGRLSDQFRGVRGRVLPAPLPAQRAAGDADGPVAAAVKPGLGGTR